MLPFEDRFTRQRQLREVGVAGQRRLEASTAVVPTGRPGEVAADYLTRAGVQVCSQESPAAAADSLVAAEPLAVSTAVDDHSPSLPHSMGPCCHQGPADYLAGCLAALEHIRVVLGLRP